MPTPNSPIAIYFEKTDKRTLAGALDWPGWCRTAKDETAALQSLLDHAPRYALALKGSRLVFTVPKDLNNFKVLERLKGSLATEMGVPNLYPKQDHLPVDAAELKRLTAIFNACWRALATSAQAASGKQLAKGPRGGGRDLEDVMRHTLDSQAGYLSRLVWKLPKLESIEPSQKFSIIHDATLQALAASAAGQVPAHGPRGGKTWSTRYFVRRSAWHILDHAWEIENRIV